MMAASIYPPAAETPVAVVISQLCMGNPVDMLITMKMMSLKAGTFTITDNIQGKALSLHDRRLLLDAAGNPLLTYQQNMMTAAGIQRRKHRNKRHDFQCEKNGRLLKEEQSLEFSWLVIQKRSTVITELKATMHHLCRDTNTIIAQMHRVHSAQSVLLGKDKFRVTIYPNVDHAFIVALIGILAQINQDRSQS